MFKAHQNKGIQITFKNGWTISIQFSDSHYCNNKKTSQSITESESAEIAIWDKNEEYYKFSDGKNLPRTCLGWCSPDEVAEWITKVSTWETSMFFEHDIVELTEDLPKAPTGSKGTIIHIYPNAKAYEVEFISIRDGGIIIETVEPHQIIKCN